jgi:putative ABC transport system ATP-binding protein
MNTEYNIINEKVINSIEIQPLIKMVNLCKAYGKGETFFYALNNFSADIFEGEFVSIVGRSGSGKSTLLNLIGGLDTPTSGEILISGKLLNTKKRMELTMHRRHFAGTIFQSFNLIQRLSAIDNLILALAFGGVPIKNRRKQAMELLSMVGLEKRFHHKPAELSGGECQRVAIARALANNPKLLLADEPTGNLDSITSDEIMELIQKLNKQKGITIVMITHELEMAHRVSNRIFHLNDGKIMLIEQLNN